MVDYFDLARKHYFDLNLFLGPSYEKIGKDQKSIFTRIFLPFNTKNY